MFEKVEDIEKKYKGILNNPDSYLDVKISKEIKKLQPIVQKYTEYKKVSAEIAGARALLDDPELTAMANAEIAENQNKLQIIEEELKLLLLPRDERDDANVILEIRPAAGGDEAALFAGVLLRMYNMFAVSRGFNVEIADIEETEIGGIKYVTAVISGSGAYSFFKFESGVHRVQRVPETEAQGRIHTSTATVAVLPEATEVNFKIDEKDLRIDVYRASGAGGQHINKTESAVRITHLPTDMAVACQDQRSQIANKEKAMMILTAKLADYYQELEDKKYADVRANQVGSGGRSERIRTYNYPQRRVTDHRINRTEYNLEGFTNGDIGDMINALRIADTQKRLIT